MKSKNQKFFLILPLVIMLIAVNFSFQTKENEAEASSVELGFTSLSPSGSAGGEIIPASCDSSYRYSEETGIYGNYFSGYDHTYNRPLKRRGIAFPDIPSSGSYAVDRFLNSHGQVFCFGNQGGPTYFLPANTWAEFQSFWNAAVANRLPGIYIIPDLDIGNDSGD